MSVHKKLMQARVNLQGKTLAKSGHNKFAGYKYFELGDFLPSIQEIFFEIGLCGTVSFSSEEASLTITDTDDGGEIVLKSPMSSAALKGCHEVQNLGAVQTYLRRYLWVSAMEIVEHDALDSTTKDDEPAKKYLPSKPKDMPKNEGTKPIVKIEGKDLPWQIKITESDPGFWIGAASTAVLTMLELALSEDDVKNIFKVNRSIFDKLKEEEKETYDDIMVKFKEYKEKFNKE